MPISALNRFTDNFQRAIDQARILALDLGHAEINSEHLLYGLAAQKGSLGADILFRFNLSPEELKKIISALKPAKKLIDNEVPKFGHEAKKIIRQSAVLAYLYRHKYIGTEHLLAALLEVNGPNLIKIFLSAKTDVEALRQNSTATFKSTSKLPELTNSFLEPSDRPETTKNKPPKTLELFGANLTNPQTQKSIDPVIGRTEEVQRMIQILGRRHKNNPLLLGDPGVGKTAIVEGLAKRIVNGQVPDELLDKKIYTLDLGSTIAGSMYRGEFENRLKQIIAEAKSDPNIIIFIDELHNLVGAGAASGSMDAANLLKPALARGEIRVIGATTAEEYRKHIENDAALERRFQPIIVNEPSAKQTEQILNGIKKFYEKFHRVKINPEAITAAVRLSERYLPEKFLPDKAIDLIDEASSALKISRPIKSISQTVRDYEKKLMELTVKMQESLLADNFIAAKKIKAERLKLYNELTKFEQKNNRAKPKILGQVTEKDIAELISKITGIPLKELAVADKKKLLKLEKTLQQKIIGQGEAVKTVTEFMHRAQAGLSSPNRPLASFLFLGPSGVGKTELAKTLAKELFAVEANKLADRESLVRVDMSEYRESFNISKLIGAPAGYIGYKESGSLTEAVKRRPYCLVLFDEIEKAHPDVFNLLLQILDEGHLTDASGKRINFKNTVIVMTSNIGTRQVKASDIGFIKETGKNQLAELKERTLADLENSFRPEFLNRLDKVIVFNSLTPRDLQQIAALQLKELAKNLRNKNLKLAYSGKITKFIAQKAQAPNQGARAIRRLIQELISNPLAADWLAGKYRSGQCLHLTLKNGKINVVK